jgi:hypothetical protein
MKRKLGAAFSQISKKVRHKLRHGLGHTKEVNY